MSASPDPSSSQTSRKPPPTIPFANWPTIKILNPPQGRFSPRTDERCLMYCSQSVTGRFHRKEPYCRAICIRKVFTHEVRNIVSFRTHRNVDAEGKAKFLLPKEGQPENLPKYLGGIDHEDEEDEERSQPSRQKGDAAKYWDEGWYFWHTKSSQGVWEKVLTMRRDLESQQQYDVAKDKRKQDWEQYQEYLKEVQGAATRTQPSTDARAPDRWYGPIVPPPPMQDITAESLLIALPPPLPPLYSKVENLLAPTHKLLGILHESITSGAQQQFAVRIWEKAFTKDPYILASRAFGLLWEKWSGPPDDGDDQRKPT